LDAILTFSPLDKTQLLTVAERMLSQCRERLGDHHIRLCFDASVARRLVEDSFDESMGARPLRREITAKIENMLASEMLKGTFGLGDTVHVTVENGEYRLVCERRLWEDSNSTCLPLIGTSDTEIG
jgi:ATP-dependent Clp protease ATP-binding subunit ClpA